MFYDKIYKIFNKIDNKENILLHSNKLDAKWVVLAVLCCSSFLAGVDLTVLHNASSSIALALTPTPQQFLWILDSYSLTVAAFLVTFGTVSDKFGRKKTIIIGFILFGFASVACAFAHSAEELIIARVFLGISTAMILASTVSIIKIIFIGNVKRAFALGVWTASYSIGTSLGPIIGGILLDRFWWGSVFLPNIPITILITVVGIFVIPESKNLHSRHLDVISAVLSIAALASVVYSIKSIGINLSISLNTFLIGIIGIVLFCLFIKRQGTLKDPLLDLTLFRNKYFSVAVLSVLICFGCYTCALFFFVQWFHIVQSYSFLRAGFALFPMAFANALGAIFAPKIAQKIGLYHAVIVGLILFAMATFLMGIVSFVFRHYTFLVIVMVFCGVGAGLIMTLASDVIICVVDPKRSGEAAAIQEISFELGSGLGIAILGTLLSLVYKMDLIRHVKGYLLSQLINKNPIEFVSQTYPANILPLVQHSYSFSLRIVFIAISIALSICALAIRIILKSTNN